MNLDSNELDFTCLLDDQPGLEQDLSLPGTDLGPPVQSGPGPTGPGRSNQEHGGDSYYTDHQRQGKSEQQGYSRSNSGLRIPSQKLNFLSSILRCDPK